MRKAIVLICLVVAVQVCQATTIQIPSDFATIQAGINSAQSGDTVLVADGIYTGDGNRDISFGGKSIVLMSENGAEFTTIDCEAGPMNAHWAFYIHEGEDLNAIIDGFTITNSFSDENGAIYIYGSSPMIRNCIITGNDDSGIMIQGHNSNPIIEDCEITNNTLYGIVMSDILWLDSGIVMTGCLVAGNGLSGLVLASPGDVIVANCTFVDNAGDGIFINGEPPKTAPKREPLREISNCIVAYNSEIGIHRLFPDTPFEYSCNNVYGNESMDFSNVPAYPGDPNGNISLPPLFCDRSLGNYTIHSSSPVAPDNNPCGVLMGSEDIGCSEIICSDVNGDGLVYSITDLVQLIRYVSGQAYPIAPPENSDVDLCGSVNAADLALYIEYFTYGMAVDICEPHDPCYLPTGSNEVRLGCPVEAWAGELEFIPLPIYITNDSALTALSLGFRYDSDLIEFYSLDMSGSIIPQGWDVVATTPSDSDYVWPVSDSNMVLVMCYRNPQLPDYLEPQEDGVFATLWFRILDDNAEIIVDFDSSFVMPAGEFIFATRSWGTAVVPAYTDCGAEDIIISTFICGDVDQSEAVDIDDAVYLIQYIFTGGPAPDPLESGNANCQGGVDIDDVVYLISYIFGGGPAPCDPDGNGVPEC